MNRPEKVTTYPCLHGFQVTSFTVVGADTATAPLAATDNASSGVRLTGLRPDATDTLTIRTRAATTNTKPARDYYLNALELTEHAAGTQPPALAFTESALAVSRVVDRPAVSATLSTYTSDGLSPAVTLTAVDAVTQLGRISRGSEDVETITKKLNFRFYSFFVLFH